ncbi:MAG: NlpC/P60 family protein [Nanobdellota archaeon]
MVIGIILAVYNPDEQIDIGSKQYQVLISNEKASAIDLFIKQAFKLSSDYSVDIFFHNNGVFNEETEDGEHTEHQCGKYLAPLFFKSSEDPDACFPDFRDNFKAYLGTDFNKKLLTYPEIDLYFNPEIFIGEQNDFITCDGSSSLAQTYIERSNKEAWNTGGKTYLETAFEVAADTGADPALLLAHASMESAMGEDNTCTNQGKSSLTGCGWLPTCSKDCGCEDTRGYFESDTSQFQCTARVDKAAFAGEGSYEKCTPYRDNPELLFNCVMCVYQGNYDTVIPGGGEKYFTKDDTCRYAEIVSSLYCGWNKYLSQEYEEEILSDDKVSSFVSMETEEAIEIPILTQSELRSDINRKSYPNGLLGGFQNERIIPCGSSTCLADIAEYYHSLYRQYPYVWGGESPYSYQDTKPLTEEQDSVFYKVSVTRKQPEKVAFTEPGFDCSGWVWWVASHSSAQPLSIRNDAEGFYRMLQKSTDAQPVCDKENEKSCSKETIINNAQPGDILFYKGLHDPKVTHIMIYLGEGVISHSRGSKGLVKEDIPPSYTNNIQAVYHLKGSAFSGTHDSLDSYFKNSDEELSESKGSCVLPIDFTQINEEAIDSTRVSFEELQETIIKNDLEQTIQEASKKYRIPTAYIKAIITTEVGGSKYLDKYLSGETTISESNMRGPMQLSRVACDTLNDAEADSCDLKVIEKGDVENAIMTSTRFIAHLRDTTQYIDKNNPDYYMLSLAYNAGPGSLKYILETASKRTGIHPEQLQWRDITYNDIQNGLKDTGKDWADDEDKWKEVREYPNLVAQSLSEQCLGNPLLPKTRSSIRLEPQAYATVNIDFNLLETIEEFTISLQSCNDDLDVCVSEKTDEFNQEFYDVEVIDTANELDRHSTPQDSKIIRSGVYLTELSSQDTKSSNDVFAMNFLKQLIDCSTNSQSGCVCMINSNTSELQAEQVTLKLAWNERSYQPASEANIYVNGKPKGSISLLPLNLFKEDERSVAPKDITFTFTKKNIIIETSSGFEQTISPNQQLATLKHFSLQDYTTKSHPYDRSLININKYERSTSAMDYQSQSLDLSGLFFDNSDQNLPSGSFDQFYNDELKNFMKLTRDDKETSDRCTQVVSYAQRYLGSGYGGTGVCTAEQAEREECTTQCGSYVTNVFREIFDEVLLGNGNQKCESAESVSANRFTNPELLRAGDIFSSDGRSDAAQKYGHTGIYVGKGFVSEPARDSSWGTYSYKRFTPDPNGEHVFIHSIGPVSYNTLSQLISEDKQARNIISFCRYEPCKEQDDPINGFDVKSGMTLFSYEKDENENHAPFICRDNSDTYLFRTEFPQMPGKTIDFAAELNDTVAPETIIQQSANQASCASSPAIIFSWKDDTEHLYGYNITVWAENDNEDEGISYIVPLTHAEYADTKPENPKTLHKPFITQDSKVKTYHYMIGNINNIPLFKINTTYSYKITPLDNHFNSPQSSDIGSITLRDSDEAIGQLSTILFQDSTLFDLYSTTKDLFKGECSNYLEELAEQREEVLGEMSS